MRRWLLLAPLILGAGGPIQGDEALRLAQAALTAAGQPAAAMEAPKRPLPACDHPPRVTPFQGRWDALAFSCDAPARWTRVLRSGSPDEPPAPRGTSLPPAAPTVIVARHPLRKGALVTSGDLILAPVPGTDPAQALPDPALAIGRRLRTALGPGQPLLERQLEPLVLVEAGQSVQVLLDSGGFQVSIQGEALAAAAPGEVVRARIPSSGRIVEGRLVGDRILRITAKTP